MSDARQTETIFAFTPEGSSYPPYVNLRRSAIVGGWYWLSVRGKPQSDEQGPGPAATIPLDREQLREFAEAILSELAVMAAGRNPNR